MTGISYILLDRKNNPLGRGRLECPPDAPKFYVRVPEEQIDALASHELIQLIGVSRDAPSLLGRVIGTRRDVLILEPSETMAGSVRQNLRVPVRFDTYIYPISGSWKGRRYVVSNDLSSGGLSFSCSGTLLPGERFEVVIPITAQPLILRCELLRALSENPDGSTLYAAQFVDLCADEEAMTREAVFTAQLRGQPRT